LKACPRSGDCAAAALGTQQHFKFEDFDFAAPLQRVRLR
jgi:hypothetical protein